MMDISAEFLQIHSVLRLKDLDPLPETVMHSEHCNDIIITVHRHSGLPLLWTDIHTLQSFL